MDLAPIVIVTPHHHGKAEATRRINAAIDGYAASLKGNPMVAV